MAAKDILGRTGEELAVEHLTADGLDIVARNWRCNDGELDVVARDGDTLVFCEVKTRSTLVCGAPIEAVTWRKAARIRGLAARWLREHHWFGDVRFDVVSVLAVDGRPPVVEHEQAAF
jgi:putative endonuclease